MIILKLINNTNFGINYTFDLSNNIFESVEKQKFVIENLGTEIGNIYDFLLFYEIYKSSLSNSTPP